jgi:hypothetical protein
MDPVAADIAFLSVLGGSVLIGVCLAVYDASQRSAVGRRVRRFIGRDELPPDGSD